MAVFILVLFNLSSFSQERYRFSVNGGFHSMMFWGRSFENIQEINSPDFLRIYMYETYKIDYKNWQFAGMYSNGIGVNWFVRSKFEVKQTLDFYRGNFTDRINLTLTGASDPMTDYYYLDSTYTKYNVQPGITGTTYMSSKLGGLTSSLFFSRTLKNRFILGLGISINYYGSRDDLWNYGTGYYARGGLGRAIWVNRTLQAGLKAEISYRIKFISLYGRIGQNFLTLKKNENKGHPLWPKGYTRIPVSHNFDYRFPLTFETGISISFDRIKKR